MSILLKLFIKEIAEFLDDVDEKKRDMNYLKKLISYGFINNKILSKPCEMFYDIYGIGPDSRGIDIFYNNVYRGYNVSKKNITHASDVISYVYYLKYNSIPMTILCHFLDIIALKYCNIDKKSPEFLHIKKIFIKANNYIKSSSVKSFKNVCICGGVLPGLYFYNHMIKSNDDLFEFHNNWNKLPIMDLSLYLNNDYNFKIISSTKVSHLKHHYNIFSEEYCNMTYLILKKHNGKLSNWEGQILMSLVIYDPKIFNIIKKLAPDNFKPMFDILAYIYTCRYKKCIKTCLKFIQKILVFTKAQLKQLMITNDSLNLSCDYLKKFICPPEVKKEMFLYGKKLKIFSNEDVVDYMLSTNSIDNLIEICEDKQYDDITKKIFTINFVNKLLFDSDIFIEEDQFKVNRLLGALSRFVDLKLDIKDYSDLNMYYPELFMYFKIKYNIDMTKLKKKMQLLN